MPPKLAALDWQLMEPCPPIPPRQGFRAPIPAPRELGCPLTLLLLATVEHVLASRQKPANFHA